MSRRHVVRDGRTVQFCGFSKADACVSMAIQSAHNAHVLRECNVIRDQKCNVIRDQKSRNTLKCYT